MTTNLQCTGDMDIRDEKLLTDALSTLFHMVYVSTVAPDLCEGQTPAITPKEP